jgi:GT2 family glycosyltransferase/glycosyltransferase involved in cell wall biosynthesis
VADVNQQNRAAIDLQPAVGRVTRQIARASAAMHARTHRITVLENQIKSSDEAFARLSGELDRKIRIIETLRAQLSEARERAADLCRLTVDRDCQRETRASADNDDASWRSVANLDGSAFVDAAYRRVLGRAPDEQGGAYYLDRLRSGFPKLLILGELQDSVEGRARRARLPGLRRAFLLQRLALSPLVGDWLARLFGAEPMSARHRRERAFQQQLLSTASALREVDEPDPGDAARVASDRRDTDGESFKRSFRAVRPSSPVTFQFEYSATSSPASVGENDDTRQLALGFRRLMITSSLTGRVLCDIDFTARGNSGDYVLSGFGEPEHWGTWSLGKKSAIVLWQECEPQGPLQLELDAKPYAGAFAAMPFTLTSSVGHRLECVATEHSLLARIEAESEAWCAPALPFPVSSPLTSDHNVSLAGETPLISIVILNFNKSPMTVWSARAVLASSISVPFEVIVVDNGSDPEAWEFLRKQELAVRTVRLPLNRYFGEGNNLGAESARGEYLVFLNNDAFPAVGCIDALLRAFEVNGDCGAAAPLFRYPDGRLQEAGAFITQDGVALQRGKAGREIDPSELPEYEVVDYVSAACLMIRADTFADLGGFNHRFEPAFYEDTDLCLRLNLLGKHAIVVREARCVHIENVTTRDLKRHQPADSSDEHNKEIFCSNWSEYLSQRSAQSLPRALIPARFVRAAPRMDDVTQATFSPYPLVPGGAERYILAGTLALTELGAAAFVTQDPYSRMRLDNVMFDLGLPTGRFATASVDRLPRRRLERVITTGAEWLPRFVPPARRAFFHCQFPLPDLHPTDAHRPAQLEALARCEKVIVGSHFTRQAYEQALRSCGRTAVVEVVAPPVASERLLALPRNDMPFILSIGRFAPHRRQDALIEALKATSRQFRSDWTLILCGSVPNSPIHRAYFKRLKDSVDSGIKVRFVLAPPLGVLDALRSQSSIYAHACGYGVKSPEEHFKCEHSGIGLAEALVAGCSVNAYEIGAGAEIISGVGSGRTFGSIEELACGWEKADIGGVDQEVRQRTARLYGDRVFAERLLAVVS